MDKSGAYDSWCWLDLLSGSPCAPPTFSYDFVIAASLGVYGAWRRRLVPAPVLSLEGICSGILRDPEREL